MELNSERELKSFVRRIRPGLIGATSSPNANLNQLIDELKSMPQGRERLRQSLEEDLGARDYISAITETGLTVESGIFTEVYKRLEYKLLPKPVENTGILSFLSLVFDAQNDAGWLEEINRERFGELLMLILPNRERLIEQLAPQLFMSLERLSLRLAGLALEPPVTSKLRGKPDYQRAFCDVSRYVHLLLEGNRETALVSMWNSLELCKQAVTWIRMRRSQHGASLALTYRLIKIEQVIHRTELLLELIEVTLEDWRGEPALTLFFEILLADLRRFDIGRFLGQNIELLAYQITEHTGKAGEHYITRNRDEWKMMFKSAALGGAIAGVFAVAKVLAALLHLAPGPEALVFGALYSSCFVAIHLLGGTIATKQPAMTASTLASSMDEASTSLQAMQNLSEVIVRTIRSQMIALLGNYLFAFPVAAAVSIPFTIGQHAPVTAEKALSIIESLQPFKSLSFFYAAVAGVGLFASGLVAGFVDNWYVFNNVGERLKNATLLRRQVGASKIDATIRLIDLNIGFLSGNVALGFYLGTMGSLGKFFGLPLNTRHITFSSAQFGAALGTLKFHVPLSLFFSLALSIFLMGLINLAVSFSLTLFVAIKSRNVRFAQSSQLLSLLGKHFRTHPWDFFFPPPTREGLGPKSRSATPDGHSRPH